MRLSIGAILIVTVPETIMRSEWRGDAHGTIPKRSTSNRDANVAIISIAQQASPNVTGQIDDFRAQLKTLLVGDAERHEQPRVARRRSGGRQDAAAAAGRGSPRGGESRSANCRGTAARAGR